MKPKYYISHELAFRLWRLNREPNVSFASETRVQYTPAFPDAAARIRLGNWLRAQGVLPEFSFMVSDRLQRHATNDGFAARFASSVPERGSFYRMSGLGLEDAPFELFIASPELSFVQMAHKFTLVEAIGYGYELCGTYTPQENAKDNPTKLLRLSSAKRLNTYTARAEGIHGIVKARKAAKHVLDNSASIKETQVVMPLTLPRRLHGFAMIKPQLNYRIDVDATGKPFVSQDSFFVDEFWPDFGVGMEVDTNKHHAANLDRIKDARRRNALRNYGYRIVEATQGDTDNALGIAGLGRQVYDLMGIRPRAGQFDIGPEQVALVKEILRLSFYP